MAWHHQPMPEWGEGARSRHLSAVATRNTRTAQKRARQEAVLAGMRSGLSARAATKQIGLGEKTYERWHAGDTWFRSQVAVIRGQKLVASGRELPGIDDWDGSFVSARKIFFGMDTYYHQREIIHTIENAEPAEPVLILVAPETGKTTVLEDYMSIKLGQRPDHRFLFVTETTSRIRKIAGRMKYRMTSPTGFDLYQARFGPFYEKGQERMGLPWAAEFFSRFGRDGDERDFSFEGRGWESQVAGTRTDELLIDDVQSLRSLNKTDKILEYLRQDFFSRPGREGKIVFDGTRVGHDDVYIRLLDEGIVKERNVVVLPMMDRDGRSLCPEMWPEEDLARKRHLVGEEAWWRNYMQQPRQLNDAAFTEAMWAAAQDPWRRRGEANLSNKVAMIDPALVGGNAIMVAAYDAKRFQVVDLSYGCNLARVEVLLERLERFARVHDFDDLIVETNAYQRGLANDERLREMGRTYGFRIHPHETGHNKTDPDLGVSRMASGFMKEEIRFPAASPEDRDAFGPAKSQLLNWSATVPTRRRRQDCVMVLWFGWRWWENQRRKLQKRDNGTIQVHNGVPQIWNGPIRSPVVARPRTR
jgi:hypothetical protein